MKQRRREGGTTNRHGYSGTGTPVSTNLSLTVDGVPSKGFRSRDIVGLGPCEVPCRV